MEAAQRKVNDAVKSNMEDLERTVLRRIQRDAFQCSAKCCDDSTNISPDGVRTCISSCMEPVQKAESVVDTEMTHFQDRLQRCVLSCQDELRDKGLLSTGTEPNADVMRQIERCVLKCADDHVQNLPSAIERIRSQLPKRQSW